MRIKPVVQEFAPNRSNRRFTLTRGKSAAVGAVAFGLLIGLAGPSHAINDSESGSVPGGGTLTSNAWRGSQQTSGDTYKWDYQVSAVYNGKQKVTKVQTIWTVGACMSNSSSFTIGVQADGFTVGSGSSWTCGSVTAHWTNTNGATTSSWRSTAVAAPAKYYKSGSIWEKNVARVWTLHYKQPKEVVASI
jgi:hypothetical protein